jgi:hypothetical protein
MLPCEAVLFSILILSIPQAEQGTFQDHCRYASRNFDHLMAPWAMTHILIFRMSTEEFQKS